MDPEPLRVTMIRSAVGITARMTTPFWGSTCGPSTPNGSACRASAMACSEGSRFTVLDRMTADCYSAARRLAPVLANARTSSHGAAAPAALAGGEELCAAALQVEIV